MSGRGVTGIWTGASKNYLRSRSSSDFARHARQNRRHSEGDTVSTYRFPMSDKELHPWNPTNLTGGPNQAPSPSPFGKSVQGRKTPTATPCIVIATLCRLMTRKSQDLET